MDTLQLQHAPVMKTGMLIRKPVAEVFEAFVNPDITTQFWFTRSSGTQSGFTGDGDHLMKEVVDSTGGFTLVLVGLKAWLEHRVRLNLVADRYPKGLRQR